MLSDVSPTSANMSLIWLGLTPNFSITSFSLNFLLVIVFIIEIAGSSTNCIKSLSSEDITQLYPSSFAIFTMVAITSSASTPAISTIGNPIALHIDFIGSS